MDFVRERGEATIQPYPKASATALEAGDLLVLASGLIVKADENATPATVVGVCQETITADDAKTVVNVDTGKLNDEFRAVVGTGTLTTAMVGGRYDIDADGQVNVSASTNDVVEVVRFIDAATAVVKLVTN